MQNILELENKAIEADSTGTSNIVSETPIFSSGSGCWLFDTSGKRFFDATGGSGAINLGHQHPRVIDAAMTQLQKLIHTGCKLQSDVRAELVTKLGSFSPYKQCAVLFTVTGAEAIEAALKVARAYTERKLAIAFQHSYHGKTTGALMATWRSQLKAYSVLPENGILHSPYPILHSRHQNHSTEFCLQALGQTIQQAFDSGHPPAAILLEPIQVTEGVLPAGREFLEGVIAIAKSAGCLTIFDEIYTGFGRCGDPFYAFQQGITPDLLVIGKALGNGLPISATIGNPAVINALPSGIQTSTFSGQPLACAVGSVVLDIMIETMPWKQARRTGTLIVELLKELAINSQLISAPRGEGLMIGFDCVDSQGLPSPELAKAFTKKAMAKGLIFYCGGFEDCTIKLTPPLTINQEEVEFLITTIADVVTELELASKSHERG
ncbi:MAG: aspartate aminotransferase family protein [Nostoc sp.]